MRLWRYRQWQTDLSFEKCRELLQSAATGDVQVTPLRFATTSNLLGPIGECRFRLFAKGHPFVRNSFQPYFYGSLEPADKGGKAVIRGRFVTHPLVTAFMAFWLFGALFGSAAFEIALVCYLITGTPKFEGDLHPLVALFFAPLVPVGGAGVAVVGWAMGRGQRGRIASFIENTFKARSCDADQDEGAVT